MWTITHNNVYEDSEGKKEFVIDNALAALLINNIVFLNSYWWKKDWPDDAKHKVSINVICSDTFVWSSADAQGINYNEIQSLYDHWHEDPNWGHIVWCCKKRNMLPMQHIYEKIQEQGIWNLDEMNLERNIYDNSENNIR